MKIAVTGSEGMLGSLLSKRLGEMKFGVIELNRANCNVMDLESVKKGVKGADVVVHCAAILDEDSEKIEEVNVGGTENVLEAASGAGVKQFIFLSSVAVYGNVPGVKDEKSAMNPETRYEKSKWRAERKVLEYQEVFPVTILRPAIIIGGNSYWKKIIKIIQQGFPLIGSAENHWQLVSLENVVDATIFSINNEECFGEVFVLADDEAMQLKELVGFIRKESGLEKPVWHIPLWLGKIIAFFNGFLKIVPLLTPAYLRRMVRERRYSTKKIRKLGFVFRAGSRESLRRIIRGS